MTVGVCEDVYIDGIQIGLHLIIYMFTNNYYTSGKLIKIYMYKNNQGLYNSV